MKLHHKFFLVLVFLLPTQLGYHFWPEWSFVFGIKSDYLSPTVYLTDLLVLLVLLLWLAGKAKVDLLGYLKKHKYWLSIFIVFALVNILLSTSWQVAVYKWVKYFEMFLIVLYVGQNWRILKEKLYIPISMSLIYVLSLSLLQMYFQKTIGGPMWFLGERSFTASTPGIALFNFEGRSLLRPYATFSHPNSLAGFSLVSALILYLFYKARLLAKVGLAAAISIVVLSFSQLALIGLGVTSVLILTKKKIVRYINIIFILGILLSLLLPSMSHDARDGFNFSKSIQERIDLNIRAGQYIISRPLFGVGNGSFVNIENNYPYRRIKITGAIRLIQPVHNIFLLLASEVGIVGLSLVAFLISIVLKNNKAVSVFLFIPILITGMGDHYWLTLQQNMLLLATVFGIVLGSRLRDKIPNENE